MVAKHHIRASLAQIDRLYRSSTSPRLALFYSKLAILELCGWVEESMDDVVRKCATRNLKTHANRSYVDQEVIRRTYGFDYERHFRPMLIHVIGLMNCERLERKLDRAKSSSMRAALTTLKACRDREAHTHLKGTTKTLAAPSVTMVHFGAVYDGLRDIDEKIRKLKL